MKKIALALLLVVGMLPNIASAQTGGNGIRIRITYYSDPLNTNAVGESVEFCDGHTTWNGYPTEYSSYEEYEC